MTKNTIERQAEESSTMGERGNRTIGGILWVVLASIIWGTVGVSSALLNRVETTPPMMIAGMRLIFAAPFLLALVWLTARRNPFRLTGREWFYYTVMGLAMATYQVAYFFAIPMAGVTLVVVIALCSSPLIVALMSIPIFQERLTGKLLLSLGLGLTGTVLLAFGGGNGLTIKPETLWGALLALITGFAYSLLVVMSRLATREGYDRGPIQPIAVAFTLGALLLLPVIVLTDSLRLNMTAGVWVIGLYLGLFPTALAYIIFLKGIKTISATAASIITLLEPAIAAFLAWGLLGESLTLISVTGSLLLLGSVLLLNKK